MHSVLLRSMQPWTFPRFSKIKQETSYYDCFDPKRESLYSKKYHPTFRSEQNLYDRMILRNTVFTKLTCLFHMIVDISFSYDLFIRK